MVKENGEIDTARTGLVALPVTVMTGALLQSSAHDGYRSLVHDWWYYHRFNRSAGGAVS